MPTIHSEGYDRPSTPENAPGRVGDPATQRGAPSITCPRCRKTSFHPVDIKEGYCGHCHDWTSRPRHTSWFTFGQGHEHPFEGIILDKDIVLQITASSPLHHMHRLFGTAWAMEYLTMPEMEHFPRGIRKLEFP